MDDWSRKEKLYILQGLSHLDFDKLETKIPTRTRQEIKNAVLYMVNCLADAPRMERVTLSKLQHVVSITSKDPNKQRLKTQIVRLFPDFNYVPPTECVWNINVRELFEQIANAIEGKPVVADAAIMEILHVMIEEVTELCGGYISPELKDFIARINASSIPMPPSPAPKEHQRLVPGGMHPPTKTNIPPMYTPVNTNIPPMYTPTNTNIPLMYTPANTNIPPMYTPANSNTPSKYTPANTKIPPMYTPANTNIPPIYLCNIQSATCEFEPIHAPATCQYEPIYAPATCQYEPVYAPANYKYNPIYAPPKIMYNLQYPRAMGNYNPMYTPPMYNLICTPGKANCVPAPCTICDTISVNTQVHFEPSTVPAHPTQHTYHTGPNEQYGQAMNRH